MPQDKSGTRITYKLETFAVACVLKPTCVWFTLILNPISEAWTEQTEQAAAMATKSDSDVTSPLSPGKLDNKHSFFLTDRQMSRSLDFDEHQLTNPDDRGGCGF